MFLPEIDRDYLSEKNIVFTEVAHGNNKGVVIQNWQLPQGKFNQSVVELLILLPAGYPDAPPDMFYVFPALLLTGTNRPARAADQPFNFNGKTWQRWSRHFARNEWRSGIDCLMTFLKKVEESLRNAQ